MRLLRKVRSTRVTTCQNVAKSLSLRVMQYREPLSAFKDGEGISEQLAALSRDSEWCLTEKRVCWLKSSARKLESFQSAIIPFPSIHRTIRCHKPLLKSCRPLHSSINVSEALTGEGQDPRAG